MLESFKAQPSPALTRPTHHAAALATASQAQLPAPPGDERTQEQLHDALQIANKRALNSCSSRCDATGSRSLSALSPGAPPELWQPSGSFSPTALGPHQQHFGQSGLTVLLPVMLFILHLSGQTCSPPVSSLQRRQQMLPMTVSH